MASTELEPECDLLVPRAFLALEEVEKEEEEVEEGTAWGALLGGADADWDGWLCDVEDDDDDDADGSAFFFFLTDVGASYVRKDSKDMVEVSSLAEESFDACVLPVKHKNNQKKGWRLKSGDYK